MLARGSRSLFSCRVGRILNLTNSSFVLRPHNFSQSCQRYRGLSCKLVMAGEKDKHNGGYKSKMLGTTNTVSRPIVTQVSSREGCSVNQITVESEAEVQIEDLNHDTETTVSNAQSVINVAETTIQITGTASTVPHDNREDRVSEEPIVSSQKHAISVQVGASLMRFIKGKGGSMQKKIEEEMGVQIIFPSSRKEEFVIIEGASTDSVTKASGKIQAIIDEAVNSPNLDYSHFISLPLAIHPELVDKLVTFQNSILGFDPSVNENLDSDSNEDCSETETEGQKTNKGPDVAVELKADKDNERVKVNVANIPLVSYAPKASKSSISDFGVDKSIFIKPKTFHLTVLMLKLWNKDRVDTAAKVLQSISTKVRDALDNRPVSIRIKGLDCMRGSLAKARVLFAPVEEIGSEGRLMDACQVIIDAFVQAELVLAKDAKQKLKLHATVMNARHRERKNHTRKVDFFDARSIFHQYGSEEWGEYVIHEAHLSQRFVFDENGYYHCCASIPFPENMQLD